MRFVGLFTGFLTLLLFSSLVWAEDFTLSSESFLDAGTLPILYTCDGKDISPQLTWANPPDKTQSFALLMTDPEAPKGTWYHWVVYNIPNTVTSLAEGVNKLPSGVMVGKNNWNKPTYNGPCPPKGSVHTYIFTLYALNKKLTLPANADGKALLDAIKGNVLKEVTLTTVYPRWLR